LRTSASNCTARRVTSLSPDLEPLTAAETELLRVHLNDSGGASLDYARGVFSAVACSPTPVEPPTWLPWVLGASTPNKAVLRESFSLLMRESQSIAECLALGEPWFPASNEGLVQFCKGFNRETQHGTEWRKASDVFLKVLPLAATAGYIDVSSLTNILPGQPDAKQWLLDEQPLLRTRLLEIHAAFADARAKASTAAQAAKGSVGRNEPCPCGSGKKFKKCCAI
jgi:uncharacterized protein